MIILLARKLVGFDNPVNERILNLYGSNAFYLFSSYSIASFYEVLISKHKLRRGFRHSALFSCPSLPELVIDEKEETFDYNPFNTITITAPIINPLQEEIMVAAKSSVSWRSNKRKKRKYLYRGEEDNYVSYESRSPSPKSSSIGPASYGYPSKNGGSSWKRGKKQIERNKCNINSSHLNQRHTFNGFTNSRSSWRKSVVAQPRGTVY